MDVLTRLQNYAGGAKGAPQQPPAPAGGTPDPQTPTDHFSKSSDSLKRDGFLAATLIGTCTLSSYVGTPLGMIGGPLAALSGFSELREGMRVGSTRETLNGAAHLAVGGIITACALSAHPLANAFLVSVGIGTLAVKAFCDQPQMLPKFVVAEGAKLVRDGFQGAADLVNYRPKPQDPQKP